MEQVQELIVVEALPQITESLESMIVPVRERVAELMVMECTEDNKQECKKHRASVRKTKDELRGALKQVKERILEPFLYVEEKAAAIYTELDKADICLKGKIAEIEDAEKAEKEEQLRAYFCELRESLHIGDWLTFEAMNLKIGLSDSPKSLMAVAESFLEKVAADMNLISRLPDSAEVMAEFRSTLNLTSAVRTVEARKEQIERARVEEERRALAAEEEKKRVSGVREAAKAYETVSAPVVTKTAENEPVAVEKRYKAAFTVIGTKKEIFEVKKFLEERGITYES